MNKIASGLLLSLLTVNVSFAADVEYKIREGLDLKKALPNVHGFLEYIRPYLACEPAEKNASASESGGFLTSAYGVVSSGCRAVGSAMRTAADFGRRNKDEATQIVDLFYKDAKAVQGKSSGLTEICYNNLEVFFNGVRSLGGWLSGGETPTIHRGFREFFVKNQIQGSKKRLRLIAGALLWGRHFDVGIQFPQLNNNEVLEDYLQIIANLDRGSAISFKDLTKEDIGEQFITAFADYFYYENLGRRSNNVDSASVSSDTTGDNAKSSASSEDNVISNCDVVKKEAERILTKLELYVDKLYEFPYVLQFKNEYPAKDFGDDVTGAAKKSKLREALLKKLSADVTKLEDMNAQ